MRFICLPQFITAGIFLRSEQILCISKRITENGVNSNTITMNNVLNFKNPLAFSKNIYYNNFTKK